MEVDLVSLLNNPKIDQNFIKSKASTPPTTPIPAKIPIELIEAYNTGQALISCLKSFGEMQRKEAALSKQDSEKFALLQDALKEAMQQAAQTKPSPLKLVVENTQTNNNPLQDQDFSYRISFTPI